MEWEEAIHEFTGYIRLEKALSANTAEAYRQDVHKLQEFVQGISTPCGPKEVDTPLIESFVNFLGSLEVSPYTLSRVLSGVKAFYRWLFFCGHIAKDPAGLLETPKLSRKLPVPLSFPEICLMLDAIDLSKPEGLRNRAMIETLYSSGLRVSELTGLKISRLYFDGGFMKISGKGSQERLVPVGRDAMRYTALYMEGPRQQLKKIKKGSEDIVFLNKRGGKLSRVMIFTIVRDLARMVLGKTVGPHTFRHSFATHLVEGGADLRAVQEMLGHKSVTTTEIYTHLNISYLSSVVEACHPRGSGLAHTGGAVSTG